jgi:hypothetical protein
MWALGMVFSSQVCIGQAGVQILTIFACAATLAAWRLVAHSRAGKFK